jgi:hypothetical protein
MLRFYSGRDFVEVGGLMSFGTGLYVGRILNGAKPADRPVCNDFRLGASRR